ncbi:hypothetical protein NPX13_g2473 [Xylaria arbuscula]|uniref:Uncharacterized protein n=1 Tax=Xylaria arbuscula TaxID=114810 RepID=A0A9W8TQB5_9PEZI|nr:hypothetical protein NPX13_g2473 [Xylaria arbuscula]
MDVPLPSLRPRTPRSDSANGMQRSVDTRSAHSCCVMCVQLTREVHDLRARLDGLEQLVLFMKRHLGLRSYPLSSIEETTQEDENTPWSVSYEVDTTQTEED